MSEEMPATHIAALARELFVNHCKATGQWLRDPSPMVPPEPEALYVFERTRYDNLEPEYPQSYWAKLAAVSLTASEAFWEEIKKGSSRS